MKKFFILSLIAIPTIVGLTAFSGSPSFFEISKNLDIFTTLYKELNTYYVEELNPQKLMQSGIDEMCNSLDPYTD